VVSLGVYDGPLHEAVLRMKDPPGEPLTIALARLLSDRVKGREAPLPDLAVPAPMHWMRRLSGKWNGADLLAETAGRCLRIPVLPRLLAPRGLRRRQHTLSPAERRRNMRGAFVVRHGYDLADARVLLVDDALTTGSTAHAAASALKKAGAAEVVVAVVARGIGA
jgi:ComF family protein